jgi:large subunit ribosomal protein L35
MPKMKTNSAAAKRFKVTGSGKIRRGKAGLSHLMRGKSANRRRNLRKNGIVDATNQEHVERLLPYAF